MSGLTGPPGIQAASATPTTSGPTTNSATYATIAEMSVTITTRGGSVLAWYGATISNDTLNTLSTFGLSVDAAAPAEPTECIQQQVVAADTEVMSWSARVTGLAAGSHTFAFQWKTNGGILTTNATRRHLSVLEVPA